MKRAALVLATVLAVPAWALAQTPVDQKRPAAADGEGERSRTCPAPSR